MKRIIGLVLALLLQAGCDGSRPEERFLNSDIARAHFGRDFSLLDPQGQRRHLADYRGKAVVITFGYTQCPDVCPTTLVALAEVMRLLGSDAHRVQVLFVTLDPERDTPALLATYVPQFHPAFVGLSGDTPATAREFNVLYQKRPGSSANSYSVDHSTDSYLYDSQGRLRLRLKYGTTPDSIAHDIRLLLREK